MPARPRVHNKRISSPVPLWRPSDALVLPQRNIRGLRPTEARAPPTSLQQRACARVAQAAANCLGFPSSPESILLRKKKTWFMIVLQLICIFPSDQPDSGISHPLFFCNSWKEESPSLHPRRKGLSHCAQMGSHGPLFDEKGVSKFRHRDQKGESLLHEIKRALASYRQRRVCHGERGARPATSAWPHDDAHVFRCPPSHAYAAAPHALRSTFHYLILTV